MREERKEAHRETEREREKWRERCMLVSRMCVCADPCRGGGKLFVKGLYVELKVLADSPVKLSFRCVIQT